MASLLGLLVLFAAACADGSGGDASSDASGEGDEGDGEDLAFFEGETLTFIVSYPEGGRYDLSARAMAPRLEEYLGADVRVENVSGAGGLLAMNQVFAEDPDGLTVGITAGQGLMGSVLGDAEGVEFDLMDFSFVARDHFEPRLFALGADSEFDTIEDVMEGEGFRFASTGPGGADHLDANVLFEALGIDGEIITGYGGSAETELAVTQGETDGASGALSDRMPPVRAGDWVPAMLISDEPHDDVPEAPLLLDLDLEDEQRAIAEAHLELAQMGGAVMAPPDVPADRLEALRNAFEFATSHEDYLAEMGELQLATDGFLRGEEYEGVAESVLGSPDPYIDVVREAYQDG